MYNMQHDWGEEAYICKCKSSCNCNAYLNLPSFLFVLQLLELKNKKSSITR